jgi:restriction endonuclease Mrr
MLAMQGICNKRTMQIPIGQQNLVTKGRIAYQHSGIQDQVVQEDRPIVQSSPAIQAHIGEDDRTLIVTNKRKADSEDRLTEELKNLKRAGLVGRATAAK